MDDVTRPQAHGIPESLLAEVDRLALHGSAVVVAARAWSAEVSRVVAEAEVHLRELGDDDHRAAASLARLDVLLDLVDELAAVGPLGP